MANSRWTTRNNAVYTLGYPIIWCPKYRRKVLLDRGDARLRARLHHKASKLDVTIETMDMMADHGPLFVKATPTSAGPYIGPPFKGSSSSRQAFKALRSRLPTLWPRNDEIGSVGHLAEPAEKR